MRSALALFDLIALHMRRRLAPAIVAAVFPGPPPIWWPISPPTMPPMIVPAILLGCTLVRLRSGQPFLWTVNSPAAAGVGIPEVDTTADMAEVVKDTVTNMVAALRSLRRPARQPEMRQTE